MTIKNGDNSISGSQQTTAADRAIEKGRKPTVSPSSPASDQVSVDSHQAVLGKLLQSADVASSKAAELKHLYANGNYSVDAAEVSRALIRSALVGE